MYYIKSFICTPSSVYFDVLFILMCRFWIQL